jgi:diguanylate cyclase (GGDEF)-like protein/PAS domain S-box-containing protein
MVHHFRERLTLVYRYFRPRRDRGADSGIRRGFCSAYRSEIEAEQVRLLYRQLPPALFATAVITLLVVWVLRSQVPRVWLLGWLTAQTLVTTGRLWLRRSYLKAKPPASESSRWGHHFVTGVGLAGLLWGLTALFPLKPPDLVPEVFLAFVLAGLSAGAMSTLSSYRRAFILFFAPAVVPFAVRMMFRGGDIYVAMSLMLFLFLAMMSIISRSFYLSIAARTVQLADTNEVLQTEKELFRVTFASIGDAVITTDASARITFLNAVAEKLTGWTGTEARGRPLSDMFRILDEATRMPAENPVHRCLQANQSVGPGSHTILICRNLRELNIDTSVAPIRHGNTTIGTVLIFRDVTDQRKLAQQLSHQATHDTLTGLVNRHEFERRLTYRIGLASPGVPHALLYLDLDQFKVVNDTCGHVAGDELLRQIAGLLRTKLRAQDTLARLGGDEFGILLEHCGAAEAKQIAQALHDSLQGSRFGWQDKSFRIGVSIGLVPIGHAGETLTSVLSAADSSCYAAKEQGRNRVHVYQANDSTLARRTGEMRWMPRIQQALEDERFCLYYQPIVPIAPNSLPEKHGEILLRMLDEEGRIVPPAAFLPAAEQYGLMPAIDRWVVSRSLKALSAGKEKEKEFTFALNLSAQSLCAADFLDFMIEEIQQTELSASRLCFEITETSAVSELTHVLRFMDTLKGIGCRFSLDDFGAGLSSFSHLKSLPVDYVKIDGGFVRNLATSELDRAIVEAVHSIGRGIGLRTIAECVQDDAILEVLRKIGADYGQGFALGAPRPLTTNAE